MWCGFLTNNDTTLAELEKAASGTRYACGYFFRIEDMLVQKLCKYVMIADLCGDFDLF